ncbi:MAG: LmeA family phospholipid-binding protein [Phormidesmis sp. RL_2_1]|nr:LmeA family phospholipid-binding protein [Phormidesmis sp. RL_2_1]
MKIVLEQKWQQAISKRVSPFLLWIATGMMAVSVVGCTPASLVAQGIERELPQYVGPADRYDVDIIGLKVNEGSAESVVAVGERVRPEGAPVIDQLALNLEGVVYDRATERLSQVGSARLTAVIKTYDLVDFLEAYRNVRSAEIMLRSPNYATIRVRPQLGDFSLPAGISVDVTGQIVGDGTRLNFEVSDVSAAGIDVSAIAAQRLSHLINPLADLQGLPVEVNITSVMVAGETIGLEVVGDPNSLKL